MKNFLIFASCLLLFGCVSTKSTRKTSPEFAVDKINDFEIKIAYTGNVNNIYLKIPYSIKTENKEIKNREEQSKLLEFITDVKKNMYIMISSTLCTLEYDNYDVYNEDRWEDDSVLIGFKLKYDKITTLTGNNEFRLVSKKRLSYKDVVVGTGLNYGKNHYGTNKKFLYIENDCYIALNHFSFDLRTDEEIQKKELFESWENGLNNPSTHNQSVIFKIGNYYYHFVCVVEVDENFGNSEYYWKNQYQFFGLLWSKIGKDGLKYPGIRMQNAAIWLINNYVPQNKKYYTGSEFSDFLINTFGHTDYYGYMYVSPKGNQYIYQQMRAGFDLYTDISRFSKNFTMPFRLKAIDFVETWDLEPIEYYVPSYN